MSDLPLLASCEHGHYDKCNEWDMDSHLPCTGGREVSIDDLLEEVWQAGQASWPIEDARLHPDQYPAACEDQGTRTSMSDYGATCSSDFDWVTFWWDFEYRPFWPVDAAIETVTEAIEENHVGT